MNMPFSPKNMTVSEKIAAIELLWDDLCRSPEDVPSPEWHEAILEEREKRLLEGKASFSELNDAKRRIKKATQ